MESAFRAIAPHSAASTSSSKKFCDVFINHRGIDVKRTLASVIYQMFDLVGVQAFLDQETLQVGDSIPESIIEAIQNAAVHITIFSPNYAESPWCLEELSLILQTNVTIIPVFYRVRPSDLRHEKGIYAGALDRLKGKRRYKLEKIREWEEALSRVSHRSGCILFDEICDEGRLVREIMDTALRTIQKVPLQVATFPVGLDKTVEDFESKVGSSINKENVHIVGIVGMGGSGKTTLARELFNRKRSSIHRSSFLSNVRDADSKNNMHQLQKDLLKDLGIRGKPEFHDKQEGTTILARSLTSITVLMVLDDVDRAEQVEALLPPEINHGPGSFIIVTTRDEDVLKSLRIFVYQMKPLDEMEAKVLFCRHAFSQHYSWPRCGHLLDNSYRFEDLIKRFVKACHGLPLSLKVFGAMVKNKHEVYWESQLLKISRMLPKEIVECLKVSYDALDDEEQQMFLDVACFFIGSEKSMVVSIWDGSGWSGELGWETLVNKCLVGLDKEGNIVMHDHLRDLGKTIAGDVSPSRIWKEEQISIQEARTPIRGIMVESSCNSSLIASYPPPLTHFMDNMRTSLSALQLLAVRGNDFTEEFVASLGDLLCLHLYDFERINLPSRLSLANLRVLHIYNAKNLEELWQDNNRAEAKFLNYLPAAPSMQRPLLLGERPLHLRGRPLHSRELPLQLRELVVHISEGTSFRSLPNSIGRFTHLKTLVLRGNDSAMSSLPQGFCDLMSLEILELRYFPELSSLPENFGNLRSLRSLKLSGVQLTGLPDSFTQLTALQSLYISVSRMRSLPEEFGDLDSLEILELSDFPELSSLPKYFGKLRNLRSLKLSALQLTALPHSFRGLRALQSLDISSCKSLMFTGNMLDVLSLMTNLEVLWVSACPQLEELPDLSTLVSLRELYLLNTGLRRLPHNIGKLNKLETLKICSSHNLKIFPGSMGELSCLTSLQIEGCEISGVFWSLSNLRHLYIKSTTGKEIGLGMGCNLKSLKHLTLDETGVCRISISADCCPSLETLRLVDNHELIEIEPLPGNVRKIVVCRCEKLKNMNGNGDPLNLERLELDACPDLEVLCSINILSGGELIITGCPKVKRECQDPRIGLALIECP